MKKNGLRGRIQRYQCRACGYRFQYKKRSQSNHLWDAYTNKKQTLQEVGEAHNLSARTVRRRLDEYAVPNTIEIPPQPTVIVPDTTFWGRHYGVVVFRSWNLRRNLWWQEVSSEKQEHYLYGRQILEERGWTFTAAVIDGRRGLTTVFSDIPVQICHFHQLRTCDKVSYQKPEDRSRKDTPFHSTDLLPRQTSTLSQKHSLYGRDIGTPSTHKRPTVLMVGTTPTRMSGVLTCPSKETSPISLPIKHTSTSPFQTPPTP